MFALISGVLETLAFDDDNLITDETLLKIGELGGTSECNLRELVLGAKALRKVLMRPEDYYDE